MSIRITALYIYVAIFLVYAWKDWFTSLCGLILLMAVIEHDDMPKTVFGIAGLNVWNVLLLGIFLAWVVSRSREGLRWDMPRHVSVLLLMYLGVIVAGFLRVVFDQSYMESMGSWSFKRLVSDELINTIKWILPGILIFDGCRTRRRVIMAVVCLLTMYFLIAVQVVRHIPPQTILSGDAIHEARKQCADIGYSAVDMSTFLAGAFWAILAALPLARQKKYRVLILAAAGIAFFGQALTGGRAGYVAWGAIGLVFCLLKWRKYLILAPVILILLPIVLPGAVDRMLTGFGETDVSGQTIIDEEALGSGRFLVWPYVVDKIGESPMVGYGRRAMVRTGLARQFASEDFPHPHNMYLEILLDNGILGSTPIFLFWTVLVVYAGKLFRTNNRLCSAVGGMALSLMLAQLIAGIGSQHFYPEESTLGMWAATFLSVRVYVEQARVRRGAIVAESTWDSQALHQQGAIPAVIA